ncbi:MAG: hypothetical protein AAB250_13040, partial [Bdellovibrionota bacterium]
LWFSESYDVRGLDYFKPIEVEIIGLTSQPLVVRNSDSMAYGALDHNCCWGYGVDLFKAEGMTPALEKELIAKGGRYLFITNQEFGGSFEDEDGDEASVRLVSETNKSKWLIEHAKVETTE